MKMTYNEAIKIQNEQLEFYYRRGEGPLTLAMLDKIVAMTIPCPFDPDEEKDVSIINKLVPRGCDIETVMGISNNQD